MTRARMLRGGCLCGTVGYEVADAFEYALNCHCSQCRRATGAAFKPFAGIARAQLMLTWGQEALARYGDADGDHDVLCPNCGSLLFSVVRESAYVHVTLGTLIDEPSIRPSAHIFAESKAGWYDIMDDLPRYARFPD